MAEKLTERHEMIARVLSRLPEGAGFITRDIASRTPMFGHTQRIHSASTRSWLNEMAASGFVEQIDNQKPACFRLTPAGRAALEPRDER